MKRTLLFIFAALAGMAAWASVRITINGVQYTSISDNAVEAALTVKAVGDIAIPATVTIKGRNYKTTRIVKAYFRKNDYLTGVKIPTTVIQIDADAFQWCSNLSAVVIANAECEVDDHAFRGCTALADIQKGQGTDEPVGRHVAKKELARRSDVDANIPETHREATNTFALVIGNEDYKRATTVPFAVNDAEVFADYCQRTLGIPRSNIDLYTNATQGDIRHGVLTLCNRLTAFKGEASAIVYYAGHGIPDERQKSAYMLPVDGFPNDVQSAYSLAELYRMLGEVPSQRVLVLLDACFSGAKRDGEMISEARGVAIKVNATVPQGPIIVFTAATGDETAYCDKEKEHGIFTYYLLKHLQETGGKTTLGRLTEDVRDKVQRRSVVVNNGKIQTPTVVSSAVLGTWQQLRF